MLPKQYPKRARFRDDMGTSLSLPGAGASHLNLYEVLKCNFFTTSENPSPFLCMKFSSNGELIVSGHCDGAVKVVC